jgi:hypothetical protein
MLPGVKLNAWNYSKQIRDVAVQNRQLLYLIARQTRGNFRPVGYDTIRN